jgi:site-specific DNA recombinase
MSSTPQSAAIYCRISKDTNGSRLGVERQQELCLKLADEKGWTVGATYVDNDISAYSGASRPQYEKMLADLETGTIDGVLVVDQDRLTRAPMELETFIIAADKAGVPIANVSGEIDLSTSDGRFRARILGAVSRQESEKKSERHRRQKDEAASKGWHPGGRRPYGYTHARTDDGTPTLEIEPAEAEIVREMASRIVAGESGRQIALDLNARDIPTANGKLWQSTTVRQILTKPSTAGLRVHRGEVVGDGNWHPLVDRATWETLKAVFADNRRRQGGTPQVKHLLAGILCCSYCGATLHHSPKGNYLCDPPPRGCGKISISAKPAEQIVTDQVLAALDSPQMADALEDAESTDVDQIAIQIEQTEKSLDELARHYYTEHHISEREFLAARNALESRISELRNELVPEPRSVALGGDVASLRELWDEADTDIRRQIISEVVEKIVVGRGVRGSRTVDPNRIEITWRA